jgi:hypothetical protein
VNYRVDPSTNFLQIPMAYNGAGFYSAVIPGQPTGTMLAFHIVATDAANPSATSLFPSDAPQRECLIHFGSTVPAGHFGTYHLWITQGTAHQWAERELNSNKPLDATFVYGDFRVVYNIGTLYSGSPFHTTSYTGPLSGTCDYIALFPKDDLMLGATDFILATVGNLANDATTQREQVTFWMLSQLGLPYHYRRFVNLFVNGQRRSTIYEDCQQPSSEVIEEWFADDPDGQLYKIEDWFEFDNAGVSFNNVDARLEPYTTTGGQLKTARYRWNWRKRAVQSSANTYQDLLAVVEAVNAATNVYTERVSALVDIDQWMRTFAMEHVIGNWDSYGHRRGKNMYAYKPNQGRWQMLTWDNDWVLGAGSDSPTNKLFEVNDPTVNRMYNHPPFRRMYFRALYDAVQGPLVETQVGPWMEARYNGLLANNVPASSPTEIRNWINQRRTFILKQLGTVDARFAITSPAGPSLSTNTNWITLTGTAPVGIKTIEINQIAYPVSWTSVTQWSIRVPLSSGLNPLNLKGYDTQRALFSNAIASLTVECTGAPPSAPNSVVINEWMASNTRTLADPADMHYEDWFELYNAGDQTVDLSRFTLTDNLTNTTKFTIPSGTFIAPGGFLLVWADEDTGQAGTSTDLHANFKLNQNGESIGLFSPQGREVDQISFGVQINDVSEGRWPDGHPTNLCAMSTPTPRASNILSGVYHTNTPPTLATIADWTIHENQEFSLFIIATDTDLTQTLTYNLKSGAPDGMNINPTTGQLSWTPTHSQINTTNIIGVQVADDGSPSLSDTNTFTIRVKPEPRWRYVSVTGRGSAPVLYLYLDQPGDAYLDGLALVAGTIAEAGTNLLTNGDFESALSDGWTVSSNHLASAITQTFKHSGNQCLHMVAATGGTSRDSSIYQSITPGLDTNGPYTLSYWYLPGTNHVNLIVRLSGNGIVSSNNLVPLVNHPPVLAPLDDYTVRLGETAAFAASAQDPDEEQSLTFSLDPDAPEGATITADGWFSWTPNETQAPSSNRITIRVKDNGLPNLSDTQSLLVNAIQPPSLQITGISLNGDGALVIQWSSEPGATYRIQYKTNLDDPDWIDESEVTVPSHTGSYLKPVPAAAQQFYRIKRIN